MLFLVLVLILSPSLLFGYEVVWTSNFENEEGYGYDGNDLYLPTDEWSIDLRGISDDSKHYQVRNGVLQGNGYKYAYTNGLTLEGVLWKSKIIQLDRNKSYYCDFYFETTNDWDKGVTSNLSDFVRVGYYDDSDNFHLIFQNEGITNRYKYSAKITNSSQCRLVVETDSSALTEIFYLYFARVYTTSNLGSSSDLVISKLCSTHYFNLNDRYIQITNVGKDIINLADYQLEALAEDSPIFTWNLSGIIKPKESITIGDTDAGKNVCYMGKKTWSERNFWWQGITQDNDGAQLVRSNSREVTDKVIGINFYNGFAERSNSSLTASPETNSDEWSYQEIESVSESNPGEFVFEETLPLSQLTTNILYIANQFIFSWATQGESNLIGYNIYFAERNILSEAIKINTMLIESHNSVHENSYTYSLTELESSGYLWLEVLSLDHPNSFNSPTFFSNTPPEDEDIIQVVNPTSISLFPNPTSSSAIIDIKNNEKIVDKISIFNIKGQLVDELYPQPYQEKIALDSISSKLASGIYFVSVEIGKQRITKKMILTK